MEEFCIYLRKSRADMEAENYGEGETLARHENILITLAQQRKLHIGEIYREIVSGETIASRPVMQQLLDEVSRGKWAGVLVMEVERLARGDTMDQGLVAQTFKFSNTKIITPMKTYDPDNEFDEEYFEFGLFMSRREYKTINRRLQRGRLASVKEGKYVSSRPPYGYNRKKLDNDKGWTLEPHPEQAPIVRLIFEWYTSGAEKKDRGIERLGIARITRKLNEMGIAPLRGKDWTPGTIRDILINPVYIGKIRWGWRPYNKTMLDGKLVSTRPRSNDFVLADGLHAPIISEEIFKMAQEYISKNRPLSTNSKYTVKNPLAGIILCGKCGRRMVRRPYNQTGYPDTLMCAATSCNNVSAPLALVEQRLLESLNAWVEKYKVTWNQGADAFKSDNKESALKTLDKEINKLNKQLNKAYDLLEQGVYDTDTFLIRSNKLKEQIEQNEKGKKALTKEIEREAARENAKRVIVPKVEKLLEIYDTLPDAKSKNDLLREVIEKAEYIKEKGVRWSGSADDFTLKLFPKIPKG